ncbi:hypothetical protein N824_02430 [Pedobacter sp. V48]|nr:hypothetical protein N824_02430 [Pedobacter sp. V48]
MWLDYWNNSLVEDSEYTALIGAAIKEANMFVALGVTEKEAAGGSLFCSLFYFNCRGHLIGKHRKLKPTGLERYIWAEGGSDSLLTFNTDIGRIGGLICWENYMPLARTAMYQKGIEIYLAPTADTRASWQSTIQHIALEGRCFVLSANQYVTKSDYPSRYHDDVQNQPEILSSGGSVIVGPDGEILAGPLWNEEGLLTAELDFQVLYKFKLDFDVVGHYSRSDIFKFNVPGQPDISKG